MFFSKALNRLKLISFAVIASCLPIAVTAQITPDGTTSTEVTTEGNETTIEEGDRVGDNLFHSFDEFSVPTGDTAGFNNAADIINIFSRVTGGNVSDIDGLLRANGTANLFLINPNGIIFGENASLDIGGSFFATSADSLQFEGDAEFSASDPQAPPLLEVNIPIGLSFRDNPGNIAVNGSLLEVANGESLSLIGGNVDITGEVNGSIDAFGGKIELGGLVEAGEITIATEAGLEDISLGFPEAVAKGDVSLDNKAIINVTDIDGDLNNNGGEIAVNARNITLESGEFGASRLEAGVFGLNPEDTQAGDITLNATDKLTINDSGVQNLVVENSTGNAGNIIVDTATLDIDGGVISTSVFGSGNAGKVTIDASDRIFVTAFGQISSRILETSIGDTGGVEINSGSLEMQNRSFIGADNAGQGNAGDIIINTGDFTINGRNEISTQVFETAIGDGADINISADDISFSINDSIIADTAGQGDAGNIEINAADSVLLESGAEIRSQTLETATGKGGDITLNAPNLTMGSGNFISTSTDGIGDAGNIEINSRNVNLTVNATLFTESVSQGQAGNININTETLSLISEPGRSLPSIRTVAFLEGNAGNINIQATKSVQIDNGIINTQAANFSEINIIDGIGSTNILRGTGDGGDITIATDSLSLTNNGEINTATFSTGDAGNIKISVTDKVLLSNSIISSRVGELGSGNAGTINIETPILTMERTEIDATTFGDGNASDITIDASDSLIVTNQSSVASVATASSIGDGGNVRVNTQELNLASEGQINTSNFGQGNGGNVFVVADTALLNNGRVSAANEPVVVEGNELTGGEVNFEVNDIIVLDNNSLISAEAGSGASGGNVDIDTDIVLAFQDSNNDIVANAEAGRGGDIDLTAEALFGIEEGFLNPFTNDINASSEFGLDGGIAINTPNVDPTSGLVELPAAVGDASEQISLNPCQQGVGSEFVVTGKGGLPFNPTETLNNSDVRVDLVEPSNLSPSPSSNRREEKEIEREIEEQTRSQKSIPAQGWVFDGAGRVRLVASNINNTVRPTKNSYCDRQMYRKDNR